MLQMSHDDDFGGVDGATFSADGSLILTWSFDNTARLWNAEDGAEVLRMNHDEPVEGAKFSADESSILTWSRDGTARLWRNGDGAQCYGSRYFGGSVPHTGRAN